MPAARLSRTLPARGRAAGGVSGTRSTWPRQGRRAGTPGMSTARIEGQPVEATIEVLPWADIVRASMAGGILATYAAASAHGLDLPVERGALPVDAAAQGAGDRGAVSGGHVAGAIGGGARRGTGLAFHWGVRASVRRGSRGARQWPWRAVRPWAARWALLAWFRRRDPLLAWYLMHDYAFSARHSGAYPPAQEARLATFADRIGRSPHRRRGRGSGRGPFLGRLPRRFGAGGPDPVGADARGWAGLVASDAGAGGADGQLPAARWAAAGGSGADVASPRMSHGSTSRRRAMAAPSRSAIRWRSRALRGRGSVGHWSCRRPSVRPCRRRPGPRCAGGFSSGISSISTPSTTCRKGLGPMTISP
jgi:hypothetical protein